MKPVFVICSCCMQPTETTKWREDTLTVLCAECHVDAKATLAEQGEGTSEVPMFDMVRFSPAALKCLQRS